MRYSFEELTEEQGVYRNSPISAELAKLLLPRLQVLFGERFATEYVAFLLRTDGLQIENVFIYGSDSCLDDLDQDDKSIEIGSDGNMENFKYCAVRDKYLLVNFFNQDDVFEEYDTLSAMFDYVIETQGLDLTSSQR
ncbi:hypothetical protein ACVBKF_02205 [Shewanella sp. 0m-11]